MINPEGVRHQIHGNVIQSTSRALMEEISVRANQRGGARMGRLSHHHLPRCTQDRRADAAATGSAAARRRRVRFGSERGGHRQRDLRCDRRAASRAAVHAGEDSAGRCTAKRNLLLAPCLRRCFAKRATMEKAIRRKARRCGRDRRPVCRRDRHRRGRAAVVAPSRRSQDPMHQYFPPRPSPAVSSSPHSAIARSATPRDRRRQCRRPRDRDAVRHHLQHQHHARCRDRHRQLVLSRLRARDARGHPSRRKASLSRVSLHAFCQDDRRRLAGALRLPDGAGSRCAPRRPQTRLPFPSTSAR